MGNLLGIRNLKHHLLLFCNLFLIGYRYRYNLINMHNTCIEKTSITTYYVGSQVQKYNDQKSTITEREKIYDLFTLSLDCPFMVAPSVFSNLYL